MFLFDFHHHHPNLHCGLYNLNLNDNERLRDVPFSIGLHPNEIKRLGWKAEMEIVKQLSLDKYCNAIGECGLDRLVTTDIDFQKEVFLEQILWANEIGKPIIVHCVRAYSELVSLHKKAIVPMIIHGYNKKERLAEELLAHGFYLSFGKAAFQNVSLQTVIKKMPLNKLFLETDDADFDLELLYQKVAQLRSITMEELQEQIKFNYKIILK